MRQGLPMLPGIRSVLIAVIAAIGLLIGAFGLVATFRVAQESRSGSLQAEFAQRTRVIVAANSEPRVVAPNEKPAPLEASPLRPVEVRDAPEIPEPVVAAAPEPEPAAMEPPAKAQPIAAVVQAEPAAT